MTPCPSCPGVGKPRTGTLGEVKAELWCTSCGHTWTPPKVTDITAAVVHDACTHNIGATISPPHYIRQINAVSGDDLDYAASQLFGMTRKAFGPWLETDEEFRTRILGEMT